MEWLRKVFRLFFGPVVDAEQLDQLEDLPSLDTLAADIEVWQRVTFPHGTLAGSLTHLRREVVELRKAAIYLDVRSLPDAHDRFAEELADCFFLLIQVAWRARVNLTWWTAMKLRKNKSRKWKQPDHEGVIEHAP